GGQPTATTTGGQLFSSTWQPTTTSGTVFTNTDNAKKIDLVTTNASLTTSGSTATVKVSGFQSPTGDTTIPSNATVNSIRLRVAHSESSTTLLNQPTYTVTLPDGTTCSGLPALTAHTSLTEDQVNITSCVNNPARLTSGLSVTYSVKHCTTGGACTATNATDKVDGVWLNVLYSTGSRPAWDPTQPATIDSGTPVVPGACRHELDPGWTDGVQFVFGGDSNVFLKSGEVELCTHPWTVAQNKQEIAIYGLPAATPGTPVGPTAWTPVGQINGATGFSTTAPSAPDNARITDGKVATAV